MVNEENIKLVWNGLEEVLDPEVPVLSVVDLGIVRDVRWPADAPGPEITITPTYTGCPAMFVIEQDIRSKMEELGWPGFTFKRVLSPAWTTDWISAEGHQKLKNFGIAPPTPQRKLPEEGLECPRCASAQTRLLNRFGSTACKALYYCDNCLEPFDHFKCH